MNTEFTPVAESATYELTEHDGTLIVALRGEFGSLGWSQGNDCIATDVVSAVDSLPRPRVVIDLSDVRYVGSEFVEFLLRLSSRIRRRGGQVAFSAVQERVSEVFDTLHLEQLLPRFRCTESAIAAIGHR